MAMRLIVALLVVLGWVTVCSAQPAAPVNTPRAHPLAPNPHTSVGLFWIYTDSNTGRQWTGGTYKVKRCSGVACTPTSVVATGLTSADYQDTGLTANTVYGYRYIANNGSDSADSPTVYVTTLAADSNAVQYPDATWAKVLGAQVEVASIPFSWYNSAATTTAQTIIPKFPFVVPFRLQGTGSITNGTTTITGSGSFYQEQASATNPTCTNHIAINGVDAGTIASVNSNTSITLTTPWSGSTISGAVISTNVSQCGFSDPFNDYLTANQLGYYDSPQALWKLYFRTGDPQYLRGAIKFSEAVFAGHLRLGRNQDWTDNGGGTDNAPSPRNFQFSGLVLLGMAGHNGVWDLLDKYLTDRYATWISNYRGGDHDFLFMREKAYFLYFTNEFEMAAPDSFPRSDGTTTSLNGTITVDGSLATGRKGHWRDELNTDLPGFVLDDQTAYGIWLERSAVNDAGENDSTPFSVASTFQPFIGGLLGDSLGYCWTNTDLSSTARNASRTMVLKLAAAMGHLTYNTNLAADDPGIRWRDIWYFLGGGNRLNPFAYNYGADSAILNNTPDNNMIAQYRQSIPLMLATFGWAYEMSGQGWYKTQGDEMANAAFAEVGENTGGTGDGKKSLCDNTANFKDFGQCYRSSSNYFAQRLLTPSSLGTPPAVTMPGNVTLTGGVNQAALTASVTCTNTPCTYKWSLQEYPLVSSRDTSMPVFMPDDALSTKLCGPESGTYKLVFYALDALGLEGHGTVNVTVGDGQFPPVVVMGYGSVPAIERHKYLTTSSTLAGSVEARSPAGRSLTHSFSATWPKDKSAPTITPSSSSGTYITFTVSGLSAGLWSITDTVTDSAGATRKATMYIRHTVESQPSSSHNIVPSVAVPPNHVLPAGSTTTQLYVAPLDPEGIVGYSNSATGYTQGYNGGAWLVTALSHAWSQTAGPATATITTNTAQCTPIKPCISGLTATGTYTFHYAGTDQQGDAVTADINVTTQGAPSITLYQANLQHGTYTNGSFNMAGQAAILGTSDVDVVAGNEVTVGDLGNWDSGFATAGMTRAVFHEHLAGGDGNALWYRGSTTTLVQTYTHDLANGVNPTSGSAILGWNGQDVRRGVVAGKFSKGGQEFYVVAFHACAALCEDSSNTNFASQRVDQINDLLSWVNTTLTGGLPIVILGDFNFPPNYPRAPERTYTADAATDIITSTAHGFVDGTAVSLRNSGGAAPGGLATGDALYALATVYYVRDATTDTFKLSATKGGSPIDLTTNGTGTNFASATQWDLFQQTYTDLWQQGVIAGTATAPWGDRDADGIADMPVTFQTTRTHDSRRIDYGMEKGSGLSLTSITLPDLRATCSTALITGGNFKQCPDVTTLVDFPEDDGVRPSDHNWVKATLTFSAPSVTICNWNVGNRCVVQ